MNQLARQIKALEETLLHADMQTDPLLLDELLAEEFEEISCSGVISTRQVVIEWLVNKNKDDRWLLSDFRVSVLSPDVALAVYQAQEISECVHASQASMRSSIWKRHGSSWKLVFHQASKPCK